MNRMSHDTNQMEFDEPYDLFTGKQKNSQGFNLHFRVTQTMQGISQVGSARHSITSSHRNTFGATPNKRTMSKHGRTTASKPISNTNNNNRDFGVYEADSHNHFDIILEEEKNDSAGSPEKIGQKFNYDEDDHQELSLRRPSGKDGLSRNNSK
jgi:hypothetical protein